VYFYYWNITFKRNKGKQTEKHDKENLAWEQVFRITWAWKQVFIITLAWEQVFRITLAWEQVFRITCYLSSVHEFDRYGYMLHALSKNIRPLLSIQYVVCNQLKYGYLRVSRWATCVARDWSRFSEKGGTTILHKRSPTTNVCQKSTKLKNIQIKREQPSIISSVYCLARILNNELT
jgi:hypothetical protein